jgi:hypothetical protein
MQMRLFVIMTASENGVSTAFGTFRDPTLITTLSAWFRDDLLLRNHTLSIPCQTSWIRTDVKKLFLCVVKL